MTNKRSKQYTHATLCFLVKGDEVLLAEKQRKIGAGRLNGYGGRVEPQDKDLLATNQREVFEEIGVAVTSVNKVGEITFHNPSDDGALKRMVVHIYTATEWDGEPIETDEMKKLGWYKIDKIDYDLFLSADRLFIPRILAGKHLKGKIEYNDDWTVKTAEIKEVAVL